jgi:amino acid transporter
VHHRYFTPHFAIIIYASIGCLLAVFSVFKELLILSAASTLMIYLGVVLSTVKLRKRSSNNPETNGFKIPGGLLVPILAICIIVWLLSNLSKAELIGTLIFILLGSGIYLLNYYRRYYFSKVKRLID